jgi:hypothetical protein
MKLNRFESMLAMNDENWFEIETDDDHGRLCKDGEELRKCYPDRYDIRITPLDSDSGYALSVRHRD